MSSSVAITIFINALFVNNIVCFYGIGNVVMEDNTKRSNFVWIASVFFSISLIFSAGFSFLIQKLVLEPNDLMDMRVLVCVVCSIIPVFFLGLIFARKFTNFYFYLKQNYYLFTFVSASVGASLVILNNVVDVYALFVYIFSCIIGFAFVNLLLNCYNNYSRKQFSGFSPYIINILSLGVIALVFSIFENVI